MVKKKKVAKKKTKGRLAIKTTADKAKTTPTSHKPISAKPKASRGNSVDSLLKRFEKERQTQEAKLSGSLKKIDELELKASKLHEQIEKLKESAKSTQSEIDQLDSRRDAEVAEVLAKLGVQLSANPGGAESRPVLTLGRSSESMDQDSQSQD